LRYLDWKMLARSDRLFVKQYEEETNLRSMVVMDTSASMNWSGADERLSKLEYAKRLVAALSLVMLRQRDATGLIAFDDEVRTVVRARARTRHWWSLLKAVDALRPGRGTAAEGALRKVTDLLRRRGLAVFVSDLLLDPDLAIQQARQASRGHRRSECRNAPVAVARRQVCSGDAANHRIDAGAVVAVPHEHEDLHAIPGGKGVDHRPVDREARHQTLPIRIGEKCGAAPSGEDEGDQHHGEHERTDHRRSPSIAKSRRCIRSRFSIATVAFRAFFAGAFPIAARATVRGRPHRRGPLPGPRGDGDRLWTRSPILWRARSRPGAAGAGRPRRREEA